MHILYLLFECGMTPARSAFRYRDLTPRCGIWHNSTPHFPPLDQQHRDAHPFASFDPKCLLPSRGPPLQNLQLNRERSDGNILPQKNIPIFSILNPFQT
jgi:hypothetical protein